VFSSPMLFIHCYSYSNDYSYLDNPKMASPEAYARVSMAMGTNQFLQADVDVFVLNKCRNLGWFSWISNQWELQDPKMEVLYYIKPIFSGDILLHRPDK
jgi:hypothetical protein